MSALRSLWIAALFLFSAALAMQIKSIQRPMPSSNTHIVYDDAQILVVDVGKEEADALQTIDVLRTLTRGRTLNGFFLTHGHPDHVMALWRMIQAFPNVPAYVSNANVKYELINVMNIFGGFLNQSSPGNPKAKQAPFHFDYSRYIQTVDEEFELLWNNTEDIDIFSHLSGVAETNHYAMLYFPGINALISGDAIYSRAHLFIGYDVSLMAQCDWIATLLALSQAMPENTLLYPGHGAIAPNVSIQQTIQENIKYITFSRSVYVNTCSVDAAIKLITQQFPDWTDPALLTALSAPFRVPTDAQLLGCDCSKGIVNCGLTPPTCG